MRRPRAPCKRASSAASRTWRARGCARNRGRLRCFGTARYGPLVAGALALSACGPDVGGAEGRQLARFEGDTLTMPEPPAPRRGRLVTASHGEFDLAGTWEVRAGACDEPPMLQLVAGELELGALVLLRLPDSGTLLIRYPVLPAGTQPPVAPAAHVAAQLVLQHRVFAFQAIEGDVELESYGETVGGRFQVVLRELDTEGRVALAGTFRGVRVEPLPPVRCRSPGETVRSADTT